MTNVEAPMAGTQTDWTTHINTRRFQISCWVALIVIALVRAWFTRYEFDADSVSYLDIARQIAEGHPKVALHAYWSPGYPVLLSPFLWLFHPNVYWECPLAHLVNLLIFVGVLACFQLFWSEVRLWHENYVGINGENMPEYAFWALGYSVFAVATLSIITVGLIKPDLLVAGFYCLAGWSALRFRRAPGVGRALLMGLILGSGYYAKTPFLPIGFVFLLCALDWPISRRMILLGGTALATFLLICAPFIVAVSAAKGRFTFGDSARLNEAWFFNGVQRWQHWQGGPAGSGMPVHPTHKLNNYPEIYEFAAENMGTYPPWFDPSYWYEGVTPHLNWKLQAKVFIANLVLEARIIVESGAQLVCAAIILALLANSRRSWIKRFWKLWFMWAPGAVALVMFALIHVEPEYFEGWLILLFAGVVCACPLPGDGGARQAVRCVGLAVLITTGAALALQVSREAIDHARSRSSFNASIAVFLHNNGLTPGDRVAVIGHGPGAYWAHLGRLHVVAEVPANWASRSSTDFWESGKEQQAKVLEILKQTGARAVIADPQSPFAGTLPSIVPAPWKKIDGTDAYVYFFFQPGSGFVDARSGTTLD